MNKNEHITPIRFPKSLGIPISPSFRRSLSYAISNDLFPLPRTRMTWGKPIPFPFVRRLIHTNIGSLPPGWETYTGFVSEKDLSFLSSRIKEHHPNFLPLKQKIDIILDLISPYHSLNTGIQWTIDSLLANLNDPYASYMDPSTAKIFLHPEKYPSLNQSHIGIQLEKHPLGFLVTNLSNNEGANHEKKIMPGDIIIEIDGVVLAKLPPHEGYSLLLGNHKKQTTSIVIMRDGYRFNLEITRHQSSRLLLTHELIGPGILLIRLREFYLGSTNDILSLLKHYKFQLSGLIFSLDDNPGGSFEEVISLLSYFFAPGTPLIQMSGYNNNFVYKAQKKERNLYHRLSSLPLAIIMNSNSASASEIFALVMRENKPKTILIGEKTYGKNSVQEVFEFRDGSTFKFTVAHWISAKTKKQIPKEGIPPDDLVDPFSFQDSRDRALTYLKTNM